MMKRDILDTVGGTPLVLLEHMSPNKNVQIFAKLEGSNPTGSVKDRIAKYMIEKAEADDETEDETEDETAGQTDNP